MSTPGHGYCSGCDPRATPVLLVPLPVHVLVPVSVYRRRHVIRRTRLLRCRVHDEPGFCGAAYTCDILEGQYGCDCGGCYRDLFSSAAPARSASPTTSHAPTKAHSPVGSFSQLNQACDALEEGGTLNVEVTESFTFETVLLNPTYWHPSHIPLIPVRCLLSTAPPGSRPWSPRLPCDHRTHEPHVSSSSIASTPEPANRRRACWHARCRVGGGAPPLGSSAAARRRSATSARHVQSHRAVQSPFHLKEVPSPAPLAGPGWQPCLRGDVRFAQRRRNRVLQEPALPS